MIRIKAVDEQNILDVCELKTNQDNILAAKQGHSYYNAIFIAEAKYHPEMYPNAIYNNNVLIGFFMYQRTEDKADTAMICRFMLDDRFQQNGLEKKAFEHILRGLKIQGVKKVMIMIDKDDENEKKFYLTLGFYFTGEIDRAGYCYILEL